MKTIGIPGNIGTETDVLETRAAEEQGFINANGVRARHSVPSPLNPGVERHKTNRRTDPHNCLKCKKRPGDANPAAW